MKTVDIKPNGPVEEVIAFFASIIGMVFAYGIFYFGVGLLSLDGGGLEISLFAITILFAQMVVVICLVSIVEVIGIWIGRGKKDDQE
jgi:hypothetical protein